MKLPAAFVAALLLGACSKNIQTTDAVRESVIKYLSDKAVKTGLDMNLMQVDVTSVSFERDEARATIAIRPKGSPSTSAMQLPYALDRKGDKWVVRGLVASGAGPHGVTQDAISGSGAEPVPGSQALPAGHPPVGNQPTGNPQ